MKRQAIPLLIAIAGCTQPAHAKWRKASLKMKALTLGGMVVPYPYFENNS